MYGQCESFCGLSFSRFTSTWSTDDLRIRLTGQKVIAKLRRDSDGLRKVHTIEDKVGEERSEPIYK